MHVYTELKSKYEELFLINTIEAANLTKSASVTDMLLYFMMIYRYRTGPNFKPLCKYYDFISGVDRFNAL